MTKQQSDELLTYMIEGDTVLDLKAPWTKQRAKVIQVAFLGPDGEHLLANGSVDLPGVPSEVPAATRGQHVTVGRIRQDVEGDGGAEVDFDVDDAVFDLATSALFDRACSLTLLYGDSVDDASGARERMREFAALEMAVTAG